MRSGKAGGVCADAGAVRRGRSGRRPQTRFSNYPLLKQLLSVADGRFSYPENGIKIHKR